MCVQSFGAFDPMGLSLTQTGTLSGFPTGFDPMGLSLTQAGTLPSGFPTPIALQPQTGNISWPGIGQDAMGVVGKGPSFGGKLAEIGKQLVGPGAAAFNEASSAYQLAALQAEAAEQAARLRQEVGDKALAINEKVLRDNLTGAYASLARFHAEGPKQQQQAEGQVAVSQASRGVTNRAEYGDIDRQAGAISARALRAADARTDAYAAALDKLYFDMYKFEVGAPAPGVEPDFLSEMVGPFVKSLGENDEARDSIRSLTKALTNEITSGFSSPGKFDPNPMYNYLET